MSNEMKCTNEKMTSNTQDTNLSSYVPKANVDHTISGTLDHSTTTPRTPQLAIYNDKYDMHTGIYETKSGYIRYLPVWPVV